MVASHSDSKLHAGEDVEIQLSCDSLAQFRRQQTTRLPHLSTFHCLHPPPLPASTSAAAATAATGAQLIKLFAITSIYLINRAKSRIPILTNRFVVYNKNNEKAVLSQGNRAVPQLFFSV